MQLIDRENNQKLYLQLYEILKKKLESNEWPVGSLIPPEEELCKLFNVSRSTVRTAVLELVRQGYLKRHQGKGTSVARNVVSEGLSMFTNFNELLFEESVKCTTRVLARTVMMPVDDLDIKLNIPQDKHVIYIRRLYSVESEPVLLQETFVPYHICPLLLEEEIESHSLYELIEKNYGIKITRVKNYIEITYLNSDEARLIGVLEDSAAILLNQYFYSTETMIMYVRSIKRTDRFNFLMELERKGM
jgi:DNA-binding GntR family transcriptional regulator